MDGDVDDATVVCVRGKQECQEVEVLMKKFSDGKRKWLDWSWIHSLGMMISFKWRLRKFILFICFVAPQIAIESLWNCPVLEWPVLPLGNTSMFLDSEPHLYLRTLLSNYDKPCRGGDVDVSVTVEKRRRFSSDYGYEMSIWRKEGPGIPERKSG